MQHFFERYLGITIEQSLEKHFMQTLIQPWFNETMSHIPKSKICILLDQYLAPKVRLVLAVLYFCAIEMQRSRTGASLISDQPQRSSKTRTSRGVGTLRHTIIFAFICSLCFVWCVTWMCCTSCLQLHWWWYFNVKHMTLGLVDQ